MTARRKALIILAACIALWLGLPMSGAVSTASAQIVVERADPGTSDQGTVALDVKITGSGFQRKGTTAKFYVHGTTNPGGIKVNSTRYVNSATLIANIDIAPDAVVDLKFDIEVALADGRTGKGTDLFAVLRKVDACSSPDPLPTPGALVTDQAGHPGYLDATFGSGTGMVIGPRHMQVRWGRAAAIDGQGRIVVAGSSEDPCASNPKSAWAVARYLPDGGLDPTFGPNGAGVVTVALPPNSAAEGVAIQPDGKILVGGGSPASRKGNAAYRPTIARFNVNGTFDTTFGSGGIVLMPGSTWGTFRAIALQPDGKIVAAGASDPYALVVRLLPGGAWDGTFGAGGQRLLNTENVESYASASDVAVQTIGSTAYIVVGGARSETVANRHHRFALWRLTSSGSLDPGFGASGVVVTGFRFPDADGVLTPSYADFLEAIAIDSFDNDIVATGYSDLTGVGEGRPLLARYDLNGILDDGFGVDGTVLLPQQPGATDFTSSIAIQPDGRIVVAGTTKAPQPPAAVLWRVDPTGSPDTSFGGWGRVDHPIAGSYVSGRGLVLHPDGKIVSAGSIFVSGTPTLSFTFLARFWQ